MSPDRPRVRILGVGNPLMGDDGFGPRVIEEIQRRGVPEGVEAIDAGVGGMTLVGLLQGADRVVVVDVARLGELPGTLKIFPLEGAGSDPPAVLSLHETRIKSVLEFAVALDIRPEILVFGVEPGVVALGMGLSPAVEAAVPAVVEAVLNHISGYGGAGWAPKS